jgi:hypothetical protein
VLEDSGNSHGEQGAKGGVVVVPGADGDKLEHRREGGRVAMLQGAMTRGVQRSRRDGAGEGSGPGTVKEC